MMKRFDEHEGEYIDGFYGESEGEMKPSNQYVKFIEKLDILSKDIYNFDIDTMRIIEMAEGIKEGRRYKIELALFLGVGISILLLYGFLGLRIGYTFVLNSQIVLMTMIPWIIVPIAIKRRRGSEV